MVEGEGWSVEVRRLARTELGRGRSPEEVREALAKIVDAAETAVAAVLGAEEKAQIACAAGCGLCCVLHVPVLFPEAIATADFVRERWSAAARQALATRLDDLCTAIAGLDDEECVLRHPCAFLDADGRCSIYPVRPLICRSVTSTDPETCREALTLQVFGETLPVTMHLRQKAIMESAYSELGAVLTEVGLDGRGVKLALAARALLADPDLARRWANGEAVPVE